jgi:hypothetical protein
MNQKYTPTQTKIMSLLSDGVAHTMDEVREKLEDPLMGRNSVSFHFVKLRKLLHPKGLTILCVLENRKIKYRLVHLVGDTP